MSGALSGLVSIAGSLPWLGGNLRPAALRGVFFHVQAAEEDAARRVVTHEFPARDDPWHEDLGRKTRAITLDGLLVGDDVVLRANALRRAAEAPGPATLLHPWLGAVEVVVLDCSISFSAAEGRVARIRLRLERAGRRPAPVLSADGLGAVLAAADRLLTAAADAYARVAAMAGAVDFVVTSVRGTVTGIANIVQGALGGAGLLGAAAAPIRALAGIDDADLTSGTALPAKVTALARDVSALAGGRAAIPARDDAASPAPKAAFDALRAIVAQPVAAPVAGSTPALRQLATATEAIGALAQAAFTGELARAAVAVPWPSRDEAMVARDQVADALSAAADRAAAIGWDDAWRSLGALRAAVVADLSARAAPLPRIRAMQLPAPLPSVAVAYRLDGDGLGDLFGRAALLADRNRARHPGFLPADRPIEVLA